MENEVKEEKLSPWVYVLVIGAAFVMCWITGMTMGKYILPIGLIFWAIKSWHSQENEGKEEKNNKYEGTWERWSKL